MRLRKAIFWLTRPIRKFALWVALGSHDYNAMVRSVRQDPRTRRARLIDIVVRKDAVERRIQADWVREVARVVDGQNRLPRPTLTPSEIADGWRIEIIHGVEFKVHGGSSVP